MSLRRSKRNKTVTEKENSVDVETVEEKCSEEPSIKKSKSLNDKDLIKQKSEDTEWQNANSIYDFKAKLINGEEISLTKYKGCICIIVNVASRCGHTKSNYEQFVELYNKFSGEKNLQILAFPCNQFGKQEPGDSTKICEFTKKRNVKFDLFEKIDVNGKNAHPLWKYITSKVAGPKGKNIDWNFTKFIVNREGQVVERHKPSVKPLQMIEFLEKYW